MQLFHDFADSFDHYLVARGGCNPLNVFIVLFFAFGILSAIALLPSLQSVLGVGTVALPLTLFGLGGLCSLLTWYNYPNRFGVALLQFLDIGLYSTGLVSMSALANPSASFYFAAIWIIAAVYWATVYSFSVLGCVSLLTGPVLVLAAFNAGPISYVSVTLGGMLWIYISRITALKQRQQHRAIRVLSTLDNVMDGQRSPLLDSHRIKMISILHKAKNDLTPAQWNLEYLERKSVFSGDHRQVLDETKACIGSTLESLYSYLDKYRDQINESTHFFYCDLVAEIEDDVSKNTGLAFGAPTPPHAMVQGRMDDIRLAVMTIIENAADAGATCFEVRGVVDRQSRELAMHLKDDGPGLPLKARDQLFKPFNTCGKRNGVGLGLYLAYRLVTANGGSLGLMQTSPAGTAFSLRLPLHDDA